MVKIVTNASEEKEHVEKKLRKKLRICLEKLKKKNKFKKSKTS